MTRRRVVQSNLEILAGAPILCANLHICDILSHVRSVTYTLRFARGRNTQATQAADIVRAREHLQHHRGKAKH